MMGKDYLLAELIDKTHFYIAFNNNQILSPLSFYNHINRKFHSWLFTSYSYNPISSDVTNLANAKTELLDIFNTWVEEISESYLRTLWSLKQDYDILNTYQKEIEGIIEVGKHKGSKKATSLNEILEMAKNSKISVGEKTTVTPGVKTKDSRYVNGFDNQTVLDSYNESEVIEGTNESVRSSDDNFSQSSGKDTDTRTASPDENYVTFSDISESIYDKDVTEYKDYKEKGYTNSPIDNLRKELEVRMNNLVAKVVDDFVKEYCFYIG